MHITAIGKRVVLKLITTPTKSGDIITSTKPEAEPNKGEVLSLGQEAIDSGLAALPQVGDTVIFNRYAGEAFPDSEDSSITYKILDLKEVYGTIA